ncbi:MAG: hypothetical protein QOG45_1189 [Chloroflexota bacterium]|nr:hypothetical protein [Chloroflexota bacterium]
MTLRLPKAQAETLSAVAEILELPVVEVVRLAVTEFIDRRRREPEFQQRLQASMERISRAMNALLTPDAAGRTRGARRHARTEVAPCRHPGRRT